MADGAILRIISEALSSSIIFYVCWIQIGCWIQTGTRYATPLFQALSARAMTSVMKEMRDLEKTPAEGIKVRAGGRGGGATQLYSFNSR